MLVDALDLVEKTFENRLSKMWRRNLIEDFIYANENIAKLYEAREFNKAIRFVMDLAECANQYINDKNLGFLQRILIKSMKCIPYLVLELTSSEY